MHVADKVPEPPDFSVRDVDKVSLAQEWCCDPPAIGKNIQFHRVGFRNKTRQAPELIWVSCSRVQA